MKHQDEMSPADAIVDQAIAWCIRVGSDRATAADWSELTDWLEQSDEHRAAFEAAERAFAEVEENAGAIADALRRRAVRPISLSLHLFSGRFWPIAALTAASIALAVFGGPALWRSYLGDLTTYRTAIGETRRVTLTDGSRIQLDAASDMSVRIGRRTRQVHLGDAEASFDVAHDANRPFIVAVGDQQVRVVGTAFNIRHYDHVSVITVSRGVVEIYQPDRSTQPIARLTKGWELRRRDGEVQSEQAQVDPQAAFSWTQGTLVCNDRPLPEIVAYLNRRYRTPIDLSREAARRRFSGVLQLGDQAEVVRNLAAYLNLSADRASGQITLR